MHGNILYYSSAVVSLASERGEHQSTLSARLSQTHTGMRCSDGLKGINVNTRYEVYG